MFVKQNKVRGNRILLTYTYGYRENGKVKHKNHETIGYLDELILKYEDPVAYFKKEAKSKFKDFKPDELASIKINTNQFFSDNIKNEPQFLASLFLLEIYNEMGLSSLIAKKQSKLNVEYNLNDIFKTLVYSRILAPSSKLNDYNNKHKFIDDYDFTKQSLYRSLNYFNDLKVDIQASIWKNTKELYHRDASTSFYDCTNYYFEIPYNDEDTMDDDGLMINQGYRKKGPSKENRKSPIIQMGLFIDSQGIPISYQLFPGNESEKTALRPHMKEIKRNFGIEKTIVVADRGLNTSDNIFFLASTNNDVQTEHDGYIYGQSILGADKEFKAYAIDQSDYNFTEYLVDGEPFKIKHKSRIYAKQVVIKRDDIRKNKVTVYQKQMVYYSEKYAIRQKKQRQITLNKAQDLINNPGRYTKATSYGAANYIQNINFDKNTGEVIENNLSINITKIKEEEKYDGYYSIVTSEKQMDDMELMKKYRGLWKIEETFKVSKSGLNSRPVFVWTPEHIEAHFLTCFVSLVMIRLLEAKLKNKFSNQKVMESLRKFQVMYMEQNFYQLLYRDEVIEELEQIYRLDFNKKYIHKNKLKI